MREMARKWQLVSYSNDLNGIKSALQSVFREGDERIATLEKRIKNLEAKIDEMQNRVV